MAGEGCCSSGPRDESAAILFGVYFAWILSVPMGHTLAVVWPGVSLSEMASMVVGLFKYTTLPNAAHAAEIW